MGGRMPWPVMGTVKEESHLATRRIDAQERLRQIFGPHNDLVLHAFVDEWHIADGHRIGF